MGIKIDATSLGQRSFQNLRQTYAKLWSVQGARRESGGVDLA